MNEVARAVLQRRYDDLLLAQQSYLDAEAGYRVDLLRIIKKRANVEHELAELEDALNPQFVIKNVI